MQGLGCGLMADDCDQEIKGWWVQELVCGEAASDKVVGTLRPWPVCWSNMSFWQEAVMS